MCGYVLAEVFRRQLFDSPLNNILMPRVIFPLTKRRNSSSRDRRLLAIIRRRQKEESEEEEVVKNKIFKRNISNFF